MALSRLSLITGIALVLFSCILEPVDLERYVNSLPNPKVGVDIDFEARDEAPSLQWSADEEWWTALDHEGTVTISLTDPPGTIQVMDQSSFTDIAWYCESPTALTAAQGVRRTNNEWLVITPGIAPFTDAKTYQIAVVGTKGGQKFGTSVFIKVVGNSPIK